MDSNIMVSIQVLTYQHANYIRKALDSIIMQKVDFKYEIVISDDCSTDGTREIVKEYKNKYPELIKLILQPENVGALKNGIIAKKHCKGKYFAFLEGDDFWDDINKLQMQIDFLENNQEYCACYHDVNIISNDNKTSKLYRVSHCDIDDFGQYLNKIPNIPTASLVMKNLFRNGSKYKYFTKTKYIGDRIVHALILREGKIKYIDKKMATYRYITNGKVSFSSQEESFRIKDYVNALKVQRAIIPVKYHNQINEVITTKQMQVIELYINAKLYKEIFVYWHKELSVADRRRILKEYLS